MRMRTTLTIGITILFVHLAMAQTPTPLRVFCSNGMKAVMEDLHTRAEREIRRPLGKIEYDTSVALRKRIQAGESFDVAILSSEVFDDLVNAGSITNASRTELGRSGIGVGVRAGAPKPDITTLEALKKSLLQAKSMTWVEPGASRMHIEHMLDVLGIAKDVQPRITLTQGVDQSIARVAGGQTELVLSLISEIMPAKQLSLVGPLPAQVQGYVRLEGGVSAKSSNADAGRALLKSISSPSTGATYHARGMELVIIGDVRDPSNRK